MKPTKEQLAAMAYVVADPQAWIEHVEATFPPEKAEKAIRGKIEKCLAMVKDAPRGSKTRAERDADEMAAMTPSQDEMDLQRELTLCDLTARLDVAKSEKLAKAQAHLEARIAEASKCLDK